MSDARETTHVTATITDANWIENSVRDWWHVTISDAKGDRELRAQLCRCATPLDAVGVLAVIGLVRRLGRIPLAAPAALKQREFERAVGLAIVLAHVRAESGMPLMRALGWNQFPYDKKEAAAGAERPILSELRFIRFLQTEGEDELIAAVVRLVKLAGNETDVADLARVFLNWDDDRTKRDLALVYFCANARGLDAQS